MSIRAVASIALAFVRAVVAGDTDRCVLWPYGKASGYGMLRYNGKQVPAHRLALTLAKGVAPTPEHTDAAHSCRNRHCVNPNHLSWKTRVQNLSDRIQDGTHNRGTNHVSSKLTEADVIAIYYDLRTQQAIAEEYGVCQKHISNIQRGKAWAWLTQTL